MVLVRVISSYKVSDTQTRCCPALIVPVARAWVGEVWLPMQSPSTSKFRSEKLLGGIDSVILKLLGPNVTNWLPDPPVKEKDDGLGLLPVTIMLNWKKSQTRPAQVTTTNRVPVGFADLYFIIDIIC